MAEANALVPWLTSVFTGVKQDVDELLALRSRHRGSIRAGFAAEGGVSADAEGRIDLLEARIRRRMGEVADVGLEVRRVDGMVDIPSWRHGVLVHLCWCLGEDTVRYWHPVHRGWGDRRPLEPDEVGATSAPN